MKTKIPCENCITLPICKYRNRNRNEGDYGIVSWYIYKMCLKKYYEKFDTVTVNKYLKIISKFLNENTM